MYIYINSFLIFLLLFCIVRAKTIKQHISNVEFWYLYTSLLALMIISDYFLHLIYFIYAICNAYKTKKLVQ